MSLNHDAVDVLLKNDVIFEASVLVNTYRFHLKEIQFPAITIRIWLDPWQSNGHFRFQLSHYAATPAQAGPYTPSAPWSETEEAALDRGIRAITDWVNQAIRAGHKPSSTWLRPASNFWDELDRG